MYVVTGATGNTGRIVAERLLENGQKVRVIGRSAERLQSLTKRGAEPFVADMSSPSALSEAFNGARAVYVMIPPDMTAGNVRRYQNGITEAAAAAIEKAGVRHAVTLSSIGADKVDQTGPVAGLHQMEERLNKVPGLNVLHVRAGYFMENSLAQLGIIKALGKAAGPLHGDLKIPMIATQDIGAGVAEALIKLDFSGQQTRELLGQRDISMSEVTTIIGSAIGKPDLEYVVLPKPVLVQSLKQMGMSDSATLDILELASALNSGHVHALEPRTAKNTTPTSFETFVKEQFVPAFKG